MRWALPLLLVVSACVGGGSGGENTPGIRDFTLDSRGIQPIGTPLRIDFGRAQAGVIETMTRLQGDAPTVTSDCISANVSAADWNDGMRLIFRNGAFVGWSTRDATRSDDGTSRHGETCQFR